MMTERTDAFPLGTARRLVADLFRPDPRIYWADFLASIVVAYAAAVLYLRVESLGLLKLGLLLLSAIGLYRASLFMHEIVHFRRGEMVGFKAAWNLLAGIPMLTPSFLYESHLDHHNTHHYGTGRDAEYLPLGSGGWRSLAGFLMQPFLLPLYMFFRFLVVAPISLLWPPLRQWVLERMSALAINFRYRREIPATAPLRLWALIEVACCLRAGLLVGLWAAGVTSTWHVLQIYVLATTTLLLNHIRTMVAHRYGSSGEEMDYLEQLQDSINITGRTRLIALMFPVGLRYHALHHLFPSLPYHNLGKAHRRLLAELPSGSAYHRATFPTFFEALGALLQSVRKESGVRPSKAERWYASRRQKLTPREHSAARAGAA